MRALHRRIGRALLADRAQTLSSLLIITLGAAAFSMMSHFALNFERLVAEFKVHHVQEDAAFRVDGELVDLPGLEAAAGAAIEATPTVDCAGGEGKTLHVVGRSEKVDLPAVIAGRDLRERGEVLVHPAFAAANAIAVGDPIALCGRPFRVVGLVALPNFIYPIQSETDMMPSPNFGVAVLGRDDLAALGQPLRSVYAVKFAPAPEPTRARALGLKRLLDRRGVEVVEWTDVEDNKRVNIADAEVKILGLVSAGVPALILLLACVMVGSVLQRTIGREAAVIGALHALGVRRRELYAHYLAAPLLLALVGGALGTALGLLPVDAWLRFFVGVFVVPHDGVELVPARLALGVLLPVVCVGGAATLALRSKLKLSPAELMTGTRDEAEIGALERALDLQRLPFKARFQLRGQLRSLSRFALLLGGVAVSTVLVLWGFSLRTSMDSLQSATAEVYRFTYEYKFERPRFDPLPPGAEPFSPARFLPRGETSRDFYVMGILPEAELIVLHDEAGQRLRADQVIITRPLARRLDVGRGGSVELVRKRDGREYRLTIDEVTDDFAGNFIYMPLDRYNAQFGLPAGSYVGVFSTVPVDVPAGTAYSMTALDDKIAGARQTTDTVEGLVGALAFMAFVIGLVVVYVVTGLLVEENRRTISLMKIFGFRRREIDALILDSSTLTVVAGYLLGVPLTHAALGVLIASLERSVGLAVPRVSLGAPYLVGGFVVVMLSYLASRRLCRKRVDAIAMHDALKAG